MFTHESDYCRICLDEFEDPVLLGCGHKFCYECAKKYYQMQKEEPEIDLDVECSESDYYDPEFDLVYVWENNVLDKVNLGMHTHREK